MSKKIRTKNRANRVNHEKGYASEIPRRVGQPPDAVHYVSLRGVKQHCRRPMTQHHCGDDVSKTERSRVVVGLWPPKERIVAGPSIVSSGPMYSYMDITLNTLRFGGVQPRPLIMAIVVSHLFPYGKEAKILAALRKTAVWGGNISTMNTSMTGLLIPSSLVASLHLIISCRD